MTVEKVKARAEVAKANGPPVYAWVLHGEK
jgi:hypothetical protein